MTDVVLRAEAVTCTFGSFVAVDNVSMQVGRGEVVGLLGANGAGKTTLIRMLLGLLATSSGRVEVLGGPPDREHRSRLGYLPQNLGLYSDLTVAENLRFVAGIYGVSVPVTDAELASQADVLVGDLPLGSQRRVAFVAALSHHPEVLLLDEPTSGVDALSRALLWDRIRERSEDGVGALVTTHYMAEAQQCDRLLLMAEGRIVAQGSVADIVGRTTAVAVRTANWAAAFAALNDAGELVILDGRAVRVADGDPDELRMVLSRAGIDATVESVPATIEERMLVLSRHSAGVTP